MPATDRPHVVGAYSRPTYKKGLRPPASHDATWTRLSAMFCGGDIYAYAYDPGTEGWLVWRTEADWLATERNGPDGRTVRRPDLAAQGHGPEVFELVEPARVRKSQRTVPANDRAETPAPPVAAVNGSDVAALAGRIAVLVARVSALPDPAAALEVLETVTAGWETPAHA